MIQPLSRLRSGVVVCFLCATASLLSAAQERVVINEIHYNPDVKTEPAEFVELYPRKTPTTTGCILHGVQTGKAGSQ